MASFKVGDKVANACSLWHGNPATPQAKRPLLAAPGARRGTVIALPSRLQPTYYQIQWDGETDPNLCHVSLLTLLK